MAYDEGVAQRIREAMQEYSGVSERKMFGGVAFMVHGNMCAGVVREDLMLRVGPENYQQLLSLPYAREMDFTGKPMKGFIYVAPDGFSSDRKLKEWLAAAHSFVSSLAPK